MYIKNFKVENFKCYDKVVFSFDENINLIIGANNSGKSTLFEAFRLWHLAFIKFLKNRTNNNSQSSFLSRQNMSSGIEEISFLRINILDNLFFKKNKRIILTVTLCNDDLEVDVPIYFVKTSDSLNLRYELCDNGEKRTNVSKQILKLLNAPQGTSFKDLLLFTYIKPVFNIKNIEPLFSKGYILDRIYKAQAIDVLRNLIEDFAPLNFQTSKNKNKKTRDKKLQEIEEALSFILTGSKFVKENTPLFSFVSDFKKDDDVNIKILAINNTNGQVVELAQLGSGTLNILGILAVLLYGEEEKFDQTILLLDEPDSHLHSNHQARLFNYLNEISKKKGKQFFIITHNHELINCFEKVLYVDSNKVGTEKNIIPINRKDYILIYEDIAESYHKQMMELSEKKTLEDKLRKYTLPLVYCEGSSDVQILKKAFSLLYPNKEFFDKIIMIDGGNGEGEVARIVKDVTDNKVRIGILDNDYAGLAQVKKLKKDHGFIEKNSHHYFNNNNHIITLPVPKFRIDSADHFMNNTFIEYLFTDDVIEEKCGVILKQFKGETFKRFNPDTIDRDKKKIHSELNNFVVQDFLHFEPIFDIIFEILDYKIE